VVISSAACRLVEAGLIGSGRMIGPESPSLIHVSLCGGGKPRGRFAGVACGASLAAAGHPAAVMRAGIPTLISFGLA